MNEKLSLAVRNGHKAELYVAQVLAKKGFKVSRRVHPGHDLILNGTFRIDVKSCGGNMESVSGPEKLWWQFHIPSKRHPGEPHIDGYVFRLDNLPGVTDPLYLFRRAPMHVRSVSINLRSLIHTYSEWARDFKNLTPESLGLTK